MNLSVVSDFKAPKLDLITQNKYPFITYLARGMQNAAKMRNFNKFLINPNSEIFLIELRDQMSLYFTVLHIYRLYTKVRIKLFLTYVECMYNCFEIPLQAKNNL